MSSGVVSFIIEKKAWLLIALQYLAKGFIRYVEYTEDTAACSCVRVHFLFCFAADCLFISLPCLFLIARQQKRNSVNSSLRFFFAAPVRIKRKKRKKSAHTHRHKRDKQETNKVGYGFRLDLVYRDFY